MMLENLNFAVTIAHYKNGQLLLCDKVNEVNGLIDVTIKYLESGNT